MRAIADAADKYAVRTVKITGGQRIDLLGLTKEQLPHIWRDLSEAGFVSGHAYGKAMRTVKTCVGSEWCRFGVQDSTHMGIDLEDLTWGSWTPHKFKLAVSGCPRNCAEDEVFALLNRCPHKGGPLSEGIVYGRTVACPMHNWCLDLHSGQAKAPDEGCAPSFPVRVDGGRVWLSPEPAPASGQDHGC